MLFVSVSIQSVIIIYGMGMHQMRGVSNAMQCNNNAVLPQANASTVVVVRLFMAPFHMVVPIIAVKV